MPRIRYIKPDFFLDDKLSELPFETRLAFAGLWCQADRAGILEDNPKKLKAVIFPYDKLDMEKILKDLHTKKFVHRYGFNGKNYIQIINFIKHQKPHHTEKESTLPLYNGALTVIQPLLNSVLSSPHFPSPSPLPITHPNNIDNPIIDNHTIDNKDVPVKAKISSYIPGYIPSIVEVNIYCKDRNRGVDPQKWHDFYASKGWMIGKNKMKDWQAAVRGWEKEGLQNNTVQQVREDRERSDKILAEYRERNNSQGTPKTI